MIVEPLQFPINLKCPSCNAKFHFERSDQPVQDCPPDHLPRVVGPSMKGRLLVCEFCNAPLEKVSA